MFKKLAQDPNPPNAGLQSSIEHLRDWAEDAIVGDARARRNSAVHHHYEKWPYKAKATWILDEVTVRGEKSAYAGPLDVHSYCATFVRKLALLERAARALERAAS